MKWLWREGTTEVVLHYNYFFGTKRLEIDGRAVSVSGTRPSFHREITIGERSAMLLFWRRYLVVPHATLDIEGIVVPPLEAPPELPAWTWWFALANLAVFALVVGAFPGLLAGVGAVSCIRINLSRLPVKTRLAMCAAVTGAVWGLGSALLIAAT